MNTLVKLQKKYATEQADKIVAEMIRRKATTDTLSTCDHYNWDRELHRSMPAIASELGARGLNVTSSVRHGVTDWVFTVRLTDEL